MVFSVSVAVRSYELDSQGHLNQATYLQYCEHARWEMLRAAGIDRDRLTASGVGPVLLELNIRYHRELRAGDAVDVTCEMAPSAATIFRLEQEAIKVDGTVAARATTFGGLSTSRVASSLPTPLSGWRRLRQDRSS
jgi:acyl-CoA thioester hydrolase